MTGCCFNTIIDCFGSWERGKADSILDLIRDNSTSDVGKVFIMVLSARGIAVEKDSSVSSWPICPSKKIDQTGRCRRSRHHLNR